MDDWIYWASKAKIDVAAPFKLLAKWLLSPSPSTLANQKLRRQIFLAALKSFFIIALPLHPHYCSRLSGSTLRTSFCVYSSTSMTISQTAVSISVLSQRLTDLERVGQHTGVAQVNFIKNLFHFRTLARTTQCDKHLYVQVTKKDDKRQKKKKNQPSSIL